MKFDSAEDAITYLSHVPEDSTVELDVKSPSQKDLETKPLDELAQMLVDLELNEYLPPSRQVLMPEGVTRHAINEIIRKIEQAREEKR